MSTHGHRLGVRQRQKLPSKGTGSSTLGKHLAQRFVTGRATAGELVALARAAGDATPDLARFSRTRITLRRRHGKRVTDSRNYAAKVRRFLQRDSKLYEPCLFRVPGLPGLPELLG